MKVIKQQTLFFSPTQLPITLISQSQRLIYQDSFLVFTQTTQAISSSLPVRLILNNMPLLKSDRDRKHLKWSPQWDDSNILGRFVSQYIL